MLYACMCATCVRCVLAPNVSAASDCAYLYTRVLAALSAEPRSGIARWIFIISAGHGGEQRTLFHTIRRQLGTICIRT